MGKKTSENEKQINYEPMPYGSVLVVDDMDTNLYVNIGLMKPYGLHVDSEKSGRACLERIKSGKVYDIIFMDHLMPEMDGVETVKQLRLLGYENPIVAITANALPGHAEFFKQNGFNEFIPRPIDRHKLDLVLNELIREKQPPEVIEAARKQRGNKLADEYVVPDAVINPVLLGAIIRDIFKSVDFLSKICKDEGWANKEENLKDFTITVHGVSGSLTRLGELKLAEAAKNLEFGAKARKIALLTAAAPDFLKRLNALLTKHGEHTGAVADSRDSGTTVLRSKFLEIEQLCAELDRKGVLDVISSISNYSEDTRAVLESIKNHVRHSEFEEAGNEAVTYASGLDHHISGIDMARGLKLCDGDEAIYLKILRTYMLSISSMLESIETVSEDRLGEYKVKVHGIKGASVDIAADAVAERALKLEKAADSGDYEYIKKHNLSFTKMVRKLIKDIKKTLNAIEAANPKPKKDKPEKNLLLRLMEASREYNAYKMDEVMAEISAFQYQGDDGLAEWLQENVDMMNYSAITGKISGLPDSYQ
jgi:CheY-like chemotaxis protein